MGTMQNIISNGFCSVLASFGLEIHADIKLAIYITWEKALLSALCWYYHDCIRKWWNALTGCKRSDYL